MFEVRFAEGVEGDLRDTRIYYRNQILDAIEEQLVHEPDTKTRNRKLLKNLIPPWQSTAPLRELRVGEHRGFYDVSPTESVVYLRAVRRKPRGVEGKDWEDVVLQTSSTFWKFIEERRKEPTMSMKELRTRLKKRKK
jgi:hypothetical protein